uniref:Cysteine-rich protein n=1 Tax=Hyaloperonospora arabidopsidis TaxID=272952 RepID=F6MEY3_HYAAB|nr:cysteine-rich protein [Hyaloperonospora arabidopsidis]
MQLTSLFVAALLSSGANGGTLIRCIETSMCHSSELVFCKNRYPGHECCTDYKCKQPPPQPDPNRNVRTAWGH